MTRPPKPNGLPWLVLTCVVVSAALFVWSRNDQGEVSWQIPDHSATPAETPGAVAGATPISTPAAAPVVESSPVPEESASVPAPITSGSDEPSANPTPAVVADSSPATNSSPSPLPTATATPSDSELAGPLPASSPDSQPAAIPTPIPKAPQVSKTPDPVPKPTPAPDAAGLALQPQFWPNRVALLAPVRFPVVINGIQAGNVQAPRGSLVRLRKIDAGGILELELNGSTATVSSESTDLVARVHAAVAAKPANPPAAPVHSAGSTSPSAAPVD